MSPPITWRNVQGPNYRGANALNIAANKNLNNAITSGSEAIQGFGDVIIDQNTGEAITGINAMDNRDEFAGASADYIAGLGPNVDLTRVAEAQTARGLALDEAFSRKLTDKENQLDIDLAQSNLNYLPKERKFAEALHTANMGRIGAATGASQASTARDVYGLDEDKRLGDIKRKDKEVVQKLMTFRQQLGDNVQGADDVDEQVNAYAQELKATPEAIAGFNIAHNNLTQRTDAEKRKADLLAAKTVAEAAKEEKRLERENKKDVARIKNEADKYKNRNKGGRFTASLKRNPALAALFSDIDDTDYLDAATEFSDPRYDKMSGAELDNHLYNYLKKHKVLFESIDDQDFDATKFRKTSGIR